ASVVTIPFLVVFGGTDLIAWLARVIGRAIGAQRRERLQEQLSREPKLSSEPTPTFKRGGLHARGPAAGCFAGCCIAALVLLTVWGTGWVVVQVWHAASEWLSRPAVTTTATATSTMTGLTTTAVVEPPPTLPRFCALE